MAGGPVRLLGVDGRDGGGRTGGYSFDEQPRRAVRFEMVFYTQRGAVSEVGHTAGEMASRCWLAWKGVDLSHLPIVKVERA